MSQEKIKYRVVDDKGRLFQDHCNKWRYATKCRICGNLQDWCVTSKADPDGYHSFIRYMHNSFIEPRLNHCETCCHATVQDVVGHEVEPDTDEDDEKA